MQCRERGERLLSYLALVEEIFVISELAGGLTGSRSNTKILPDVSQLGLQGENTKTERTKTVGLSLSSSTVSKDNRSFNRIELGKFQ